MERVVALFTRIERRGVAVGGEPAALEKAVESREFPKKRREKTAGQTNRRF